MFTPVKLGNTTLPPEVLKADKKSCKRYGPCGVGEQALYLNSFFSANTQMIRDFHFPPKTSSPYSNGQRISSCIFF